VTEFGYSSYKHPKTVGPWSREMYILHFVAKGYTDFSGFRAEEGQAFLISKERLHSFTISKDYEHYWIGFNGHGVAAFFNAFGLSYDDHQLFFVDDPNFAKTLFFSTYEMLKSKSSECEDTIVLSTLASMFPLLKNHKQSKTPRKINYAEKASNLIRSKYMYPLKMENIAKEIHVSEKYMYRLFTNRFHMSPQNFLIQVRMEKAKELLERSDLSVTEISSSVGYASISAFSKTFLKYFGVNPSSLRH
jgi:AraC family transcriptional regulator of arabinose operon